MGKKMNKRNLIVLIFLFLCFYFRNFGNYELSGLSKNFIVDKNNKINSFIIGYDSLSIYLDSKLNKNYLLEKIEIIYHNQKLGEIAINKNLNDLDCFQNEHYCRYDISEQELKNILDKEKMYKKIRTRFYEYNRNYFEFKVFIKNKNLKNQQEEFVIEQVGIRFKRWYDIEIPYF